MYYETSADDLGNLPDDQIAPDSPLGFMLSAIPHQAPTLYTIARDGIHVGTTSNPEHWFPFTRGYTMSEGIHLRGYTITRIHD